MAQLRAQIQLRFNALNKGGIKPVNAHDAAKKKRKYNSDSEEEESSESLSESD